MDLNKRLEEIFTKLYGDNMESTIEKKITVTLILTEKEAEWLKAVVQNPLGCSSQEESFAEKEIRQSFFNELSKK